MFFCGIFFVRMSSRYAFLIDKDFVFGTITHWRWDATLFFFKGSAFGSGFCSVVLPLRVVHRQSLRLWNHCSLEMGRYAFLISKGFTFGTVAHWRVDATLSDFKGFAFGFGFCSAVHLLRFVHRQRFHLWGCCSLGAFATLSDFKGFDVLYVFLWGLEYFFSHSKFFDYVVNFLIMIQTVTITMTPDKEKNMSLVEKEICRSLAQFGIKELPKDSEYVLEKRSVDARHGRIKIHLKYKIFIGEKAEVEFVPKWKKCDGQKSVIVVGSGPAGLFGALKLMESGIKPIIVERGNDAAKRKRDIAAISTQGKVDGDSNYCFGEGGAGTFSDGKLYTRSNKRGDISQVLSIFAYFGADKKILTDAHPHIGTDKLPSIIQNMRNKIIELGGEIHFGSRCVDLLTEENGNGKTVKGIAVENLSTGERSNLFADAVLLTTGHSAPDIYRMIARISPESLEAKTFAVGVRVEHPRKTIDLIRYHSMETVKKLGAAEYLLVTQADGRGVYSFCMCPGGFVVPSASGPDEIVVNGMSAAGRNSAWSNAAIVVETRPEDIPQEYVDAAEKNGCKALAGLLWRQWLENLTFKKGEGQKAPAQLLVDFLDGKESQELPKSSYAPGLVPTRLDQWLPKQISSRLKKAFRDFNKEMRGYICGEALMIAMETRTSTPVRISRDKESLVCVGLENLYPAGEGSGYAGGIVSSAMDGIKVCEKIIGKEF